MPLRDELARFRDEFFAGVDPETRSAMRRADEMLAASWQFGRGRRAGEQAPDFRLSDPRGGTVSLWALLRAGPVVLSFYRGDWCPYCGFELEALTKIHPEIERFGAKLVAVSPQKPELLAAVHEKLPFALGTDPGCRVARAYGVAYPLPKILRPIYAGSGHALPDVNASGDWMLPLPATYIIDRTGEIVLSFVDVNYRNRLEPGEFMPVLASLQRQRGK